MSDDPDYTRGESSRGRDSRLSRDKSRESRGCHHKSPHHDKHRHHNFSLDAISRALRRAIRSPFSEEIKCTEILRRFTCPPFTICDGKNDPVEHVNYYIQMMSLYSQNDGLMCKVFPSSLGPMAMRWFNGLRIRSIQNFRELMQVFRSRFIMCHKFPQPIDAFLSMRMRSGETFRFYVNRYWELYNEIGKENERVATSTFQLRLLEEAELRDSLTMRPLENMH